MLQDARIAASVCCIQSTIYFNTEDKVGLFYIFRYCKCDFLKLSYKFSYISVMNHIVNMEIAMK